jgi:hypothetical protein
MRTPQSRPAGKFKVRLITEPNWTPAVDRPLETWTKPNVQDFEEAFTPNKHNILFRSLLKVKDAPVNPASMQVTFSISELWIKLQLFDNDVEVFSGRGKGVVTIPVYFFLMAEEPKPEKGKDDKSAKDKPMSQGAARNIAQKHKYVLQAIVERPELSKSITAGSVAESTRPSSRGIKTANEKSSVAGSAKKKKAATPSGIEEKTPNFNEPSWHLRIVSIDTASMIVQRDTEKEDRYKAAKDAWESSQPGRSARAQEIRNMYVKAVESSIVQPIVIPDASSQSGCKPWTILKPPVVVQDTATKPMTAKSPSSLNVIAEDGWATIQEERRQKLQEELSIFEDLRAARKSEKDKRLSQNVLRDILERQAQEIEELSKADNVRRLDYRARLLKELDIEAKAIEAAKSAEIAALAQVDEAAALEKKKKGGKK